VPVPGICYGEQTMAQQLGGQVEAGHRRGRFVSGRPEGDIGTASSVPLVPVAVAAFFFT
jgi:anthranilate/para-aminobenzoate synthase component II